MKRTPQLASLLWIFLFLVVTSACKEDEVPIQVETIEGHVQKGPFNLGTSIKMLELNAQLEQTGVVNNTQVTNNAGSFVLNDITLSESYIEIKAEGIFFDEVLGDISGSSLQLGALSDVTQRTTLNVNVLTQLEMQRVKYLVTHGENFENAKSISQKEIRDIFGFSFTKDQCSESLDITVQDDNNAMLLAISLILKSDRSTEALTKLIDNISSDISQDGILDDTMILKDLRSAAKKLQVKTIRQNLDDRYSSLAMNASIPEFEKYIDNFLSFSAIKPEVTTIGATKIGAEEATLNGYVNPNSSLTNVAFEYGTTTEFGNTVSADQSPVSGEKRIQVSAVASDLARNTTYYFRIVAENEIGVSYSDTLTFMTNVNGLKGTVTDIDGNTYTTIGIGYQIWLAENLKTTHYADGTEIPLVEDIEAWSMLTEQDQAMCYFENSSDRAEIYGALYNWAAAMNGAASSNEIPSGIQGVCPSGWHLPGRDEWQQLINFLGGSEVAADQLKEAGTEHWNFLNTDATNESGFTGLPGGSRSETGDFWFEDAGIWWSSTELGTEPTSAYDKELYPGSAGVTNSYIPKKTANSVRCIKD